jgi:carbon-monoxide dehydrogenase iron sulfur subunit
MKELSYQIKKCLGCRSCEVACALAHSLSPELFKALQEKVLSLPRKKVYASGDKNYPLSCRHCKEPLCVMACMSGALTKDKKTGLVLIDKEKCVGCWMCLMICPYGAIRTDLKTKIPLRCDMCKDLDTPQCVRSCPTKAIILSEGEDK